jgi:hypothetical protein
MHQKLIQSQNNKNSILPIPRRLKFLMAVLSLITITTLLIGLYSAARADGFGSNNTAGWMQAIGTILAIVGSFLITENQSRKNSESILEAQKLASIAKKNGILAVVQAAKMHAKNISSAVSPETPLKIYEVYHPSIISSVSEALSSAPLYEIDSPEAVGALLSLSNRFVFLGASVEAFIAGPWKNENMKGLLENLRDTKNRSQLLSTLKSSNQVLAGNVQTITKGIYEQIQIIELNLGHSQHAQNAAIGLPTPPNAPPKA